MCVLFIFKIKHITWLTTSKFVVLQVYSQLDVHPTADTINQLVFVISIFFRLQCS